MELKELDKMISIPEDFNYDVNTVGFSIDIDTNYFEKGNIFVIVFKFILGRQIENSEFEDMARLNLLNSFKLKYHERIIKKTKDKFLIHREDLIYLINCSISHSRAFHYDLVKDTVLEPFSLPFIDFNDFDLGKEEFINTKLSI